MNAEADTCKERLEQFMRRDLAGWMGLSGQCAEHDVARWLPLREGEGVGWEHADAEGGRHADLVARFRRPEQTTDFRIPDPCIPWSAARVPQAM
jgi:hypothetical protein